MINILIMEDESTSRFLLKQIMKEYGTVTDVDDGLKALNAYKKSVEDKEYYDLICLDIMVPEMDGQEVLQRIRQIEEEMHLDRLNVQSKVIMITALDDSDNFLNSFKEQADGYIIKPFDKEKIERTIKKLKLIK